ncbi:MAG: glycosyltransferase family 2 protein [Clostridiaceae bacterium]|nr:glycosyltransferase family 2 protein [Clostridiaceae bacterium]
MSKARYSIVVPVFNEEEVIGESYKRLKEVMDSTKEPYEIIFINDGSRDSTYEILNTISETNAQVKIIDFSRNFGHQVAISAGMDYASGSAVVVIDADLQDPPEVILRMIEKWKEGFDVVYGKRLKRNGETIFKKITARLYYRILKSMTNVDIPTDVGDFRLIDRKVCEVMKSLTEKSRYVRGLISWVGFKQTSVEYEREERFAGETKYPLVKMIGLAADGITSFSYKPLKLASYLGFIVSFFSFLFLLYVAYEKLFTNKTVQGWASLIAVCVLMNGVMFILLGIMGEYIGRIFEESKNRPLYIVKNELGFKNASSEDK